MSVSKYITEDVIKTAIRVIEKDVKPGWKVNPDKKVIKGIFKGLIRCSGECPCNNNSEEKLCPCSGYRKEDKCCCGLYIRKGL